MVARLEDTSDDIDRVMVLKPKSRKTIAFVSTSCTVHATRIII